ncbi:MAG TPA: hypothetical protein VHN78_02670, partial [Chloroflexota bacterium]|nr:hypothetical protein [Chloroflexota bacterium]
MRAPGRWVPDLIDAAGGIPVLVEAGDDSAAVLPDALAEARPEVLLLAVPDDPQARAAELTGLLAQAPWSNLPARHLGRTWALRFDGLFRHGNPRLVEGVEVLVRIITPEALGANGTPPAAERALLL